MDQVRPISELSLKELFDVKELAGDNTPPAVLEAIEVKQKEQAAPAPVAPAVK
jgi:hypothetical protein